MVGMGFGAGLSVWLPFLRWINKEISRYVIRWVFYISLLFSMQNSSTP
jgi:hypothetical protein